LMVVTSIETSPNMICLNTCLLLISLLGVTVDSKEFPAEPTKEEQQIKEAFSTPEDQDEDLTSKRQSRQTTFTSFPSFSGSQDQAGFSFQTILLGEDVPENLQQLSEVQPATPGNIQPDLVAPAAPVQQEGSQDPREPRFTLDDLSFEGFQLNTVFGSPTPQLNTQNRPELRSFENFPNFQSQQFAPRNPPSTAARSRSGTRARARSQVPSFSQVTTSVPSISFTPLPNPPRLPQNADPRSRTDRLGQGISESQRSALQNFPSLSRSDILSREDVARDQLRRRTLKRMRVGTRTPQFTTRVVTRVPQVITAEPTTTENNLAQRELKKVEKRLNEAVRKSEKEKRLIQDCRKEAKAYEKEIEELENRTALHIEYAQEKQIEIEMLEIGFESFKNQSLLDKEEIETLKNRVSNLTNAIEVKDENITNLEDDLEKLEETFKNETARKHTEILELTREFATTVKKLETNKQLLIAEETKNKKIFTDLKEASAKVEKLKKDKKKLLQIVQQLAEIGNPALNFMSEFIIDEKETEDDVYEENFEEPANDIEEYEVDNVIDNAGISENEVENVVVDTEISKNEVENITDDAEISEIEVGNVVNDAEIFEAEGSGEGV